MINQTTRKRWFTLLGVLVAILAVLVMGAQQARNAFLLRGIPAELPEPIPHGGAQLGINVYLEQYDDAELDSQLAAISEAGIRHVKQSFYFRDGFAWEEADRLITAVSRHNLTLIPLLDGNPENSFVPPANPNDFANWAAEFATRYGKQFEHYIIWDEPNLAEHWGNKPANANEYAALLTATATAIRTADQDAVIVAAPLAPTVETGPKNVADWLYLQQLYEAGSADAFDVAAAKPYGFETGPDDRTVDNSVLNFSRSILMREVMERNGDSYKAIWAGNWGWNALSDEWTGGKSLWGKATVAEKADFTAAAFARAQLEWPWMGLMFLENWQPNAPKDDPRWGFSLDRHDFSRLTNHTSRPPGTGFHLAQNSSPYQAYSGGWRFSPEFGADISESGNRVTFTFWGTDLGMRVRRANFRARLYVTVDGQPANALPRDENGSMLILTSPDPSEDYITTELIAENLELGEHTVEIVASRGWDQWALHGFSVGYQPSNAGFVWGQIGLGLTAVLALLFAYRNGKRANWGAFGRVRQGFERLGDGGQLVLTAVFGLIVGLSGWFTWVFNEAYYPFGGIYRRLGDLPQLAFTAAAATIFYVTPNFLIYLVALAILFLLIYLRPAWGLALVALSFPFYVNDTLKPILDYQFSPSEVFTLVAFAAVISKQLAVNSEQWKTKLPTVRCLLFTDYLVLLLIIIATASLFFTERLGVAQNEWRVVIVEPALFYMMLRLVKPTRREMWVILDSFVLGGVIVALIGLWQYGTGQNLITAEGGLLRLRAFYGSPNNVALYLGRVLPLLAAMFLLGQQNGRRRWFYTAATIPIGLAILLTFSKGGLLLGVPAGLTAVFWLWQRQAGRKTWPWLLGAGALGLIGLVAIQQIPQLAERFSLGSATAVFRLNLWQASLEMVRQQPLFGVGLDNFLYAYRGRYILDAAWQEPNLNHPHNIVLDFATRLGLLGLLAGSWLFVHLGQQLIKAYVDVTATTTTEWRPVVVGFIGTLAAILAHGLVDHSFFLVDLAFVFYLVLGTAVWLNQTSEP